MLHNHHLMHIVSSKSSEPFLLTELANDASCRHLLHPLLGLLIINYTLKLANIAYPLDTQHEIQVESMSFSPNRCGIQVDSTLYVQWEVKHQQS